ncbi:hypothetical protein E2562_025523 [Oryza meyeriana var. granulata]|uniref:BED-type domain-containing protein n=1 Tax=Oryza meyeriana var. granulata TaxID=110450 RepID=A0A6G1FC85_9ORYZ|nr:hypothetical protein E2562_025523 [Oryza meyeriana var. granulata]
MAENNHQPTITPDHSRWSECWNHFEKKAGQKAACKYCQMQLSTKNGTTRLNRHYQETCPVRHPKPGRSGRQGSHGASAQAGIHSLQNASTFSRSSSDNSGQQTAAAAAEDQLIRMIALHGFPSSMVEDVQFIRFVQMLCPDFKMPSRDDVRKRCDELFDQEISSLKDALGRTPGLVFKALQDYEYYGYGDMLDIKGIICMVGEGFRQLFIEYNNQGHETEQGNQSNGMDQTNHVNEMDVDTSQQEHGSTWQLIDQSGMDQNNTISHESLTELDAYLQDETVPVEQEDFDILKWWEENCNRYPTLARMARDFLAIPVASKPSPQLMTEITNHLRRYA